MGKTPLEELGSLWKSSGAKSTEGICRLFAVGHVMPIPGFPAARFVEQTRCAGIWNDGRRSRLAAENRELTDSSPAPNGTGRRMSGGRCPDQERRGRKSFSHPRKILPWIFSQGRQGNFHLTEISRVWVHPEKYF